MSVVVGHSVAGYATAEAFGPPVFDRWWKAALAAAVVANLPDMDFALGLLVGDPEGWHHGASHSLFAAVLAGIVAGLLARRFGPTDPAGRTARSRRFWTGFLYVAPIYASHVLLDTVAPERGKPDVGVPLLWPLSDTDIAARIPMPAWLADALALADADVSGGYIEMLLAPDTVITFATEAVLFAPLFLLALRIRRAREPAAHRH